MIREKFESTATTFQPKEKQRNFISKLFNEMFGWEKVFCITIEMIEFDKKVRVENIYRIKFFQY